MEDRIRRSLLYVPASSEAMVRKAGGRGADVLILDLEDGVVPEAKDQARSRLQPLLEEVDFGGAEVLVRANAASTEWGRRDLETLAELRPAGVAFPKIESPQTVTDIDDALDRAVPLFLMLETVPGVMRAAEIACASPRVAGLMFGAADYRESLRAWRDPEELELHFARSQLLHAARLAGAEAFDTPWFEYRDQAGLEASARRVRQLGFDGKTAIHPLQVPVINDVFAPTAAEISRAHAVVEAMEEARSRGSYVATVDGEMVEALHLKQARRTLDRAARLGLE